MTIKARHDWIDSLKFLGMFAIYIGHLGAGAGKLYPFVFSYHVPLFFFMSGFFSKEGGDKIIYFILDKAKRLLLPYLLYCLILLFMNSLGGARDLNFIANAIVDILYGVRNNEFVGTIWFLNCLFTMLVIDRIAFSVFRSKWMVLVVSIIAFIYTQKFMGHNPLRDPMWFLNIDSAIAYWWLLAFGRVALPFISNSNIMRFSYQGIAVFLILSIVTMYQLLNSASIVSYLADRYVPILSSSYFFGVFNTLSTTSALIFFNIFIAKLISNSAAVNRIGRNSLNLCGLENITKSLIPATVSVFGLSIAIQNPLSAICYTVVCLIISDIIGRWMSRNIGMCFKIR